MRTPVSIKLKGYIAKKKLIKAKSASVRGSLEIFASVEDPANMFPTTEAERILFSCRVNIPCKNMRRWNDMLSTSICKLNQMKPLFSPSSGGEGDKQNDEKPLDKLPPLR